ncbi:phospholipid/cholesterol/gamma-HCH transport system substrate-binding protein [Polaromonas sp. OV174]|uniref:MlaD family protein n=1 Tax=Polaromonas sp. OV174 TaxID=1855300 RepID=UPI0008E63717|nr:MlaD family protein [Polaromonas sp. OV174]SFC39727.1 phospholipid/cholesterol/gamma-HCH transport system substrate-binding protein [Polaromonas sp. OV174]
MSSPQDPSDPSDPLSPPAAARTDNLELKARLLLLFMLLLICGSALFVLYARGAFDATQRLVLVAEDSEGVVVGMDLTFSGFPIGRVQRIELAEDGKARILVDVASKDAHWLRTTSVFTLVKGIVGGTNIRAYTGVLTDPLLPDGAVRNVLQGDASAEIPKVIAAAKDLIENLNNLTGSSGSVGASLANLQTLTERLNGPGGALTVLLGSEAEAKKFSATLDRTNALLAKVDGMAAKADTQVFGEKGVMPETRATIVQLNAMLGEARGSLKRVDAVLQDAQAISANAKDATADLGALRADVEANLRKVEGLINDISRKWPFAKDAKDAEMKLP